ncbi:hypothetical protein OS493_040626, partial [Desmophyllum pertusum]
SRSAAGLMEWDNPSQALEVLAACNHYVIRDAAAKTIFTVNSPSHPCQALNKKHPLVAATTLLALPLTNVHSFTTLSGAGKGVSRHRATLRREKGFRIRKPT